MASFKIPSISPYVARVPGGTEVQHRYKRKNTEKPPVRPKPAYLRQLFCAGARRREGGWARRVRLALAADLMQGRCRAADNAIAAINKHFVTVLSRCAIAFVTLVEGSSFV